MKNHLSISALILSLFAFLYIGSIIEGFILCDDAKNVVCEVGNSSLHEYLYYCGPKTRDYTDTPPGGGIVLIPIVLVIGFVVWLFASIYTKIDENKERARKRQNLIDDLYKLSHSNYSKEGSLKNGVQLVKISYRRYGYVDTQGIPLIQEIFHEAEEFIYPTAIVQQDGKYALLSNKGVYVVNFGASSWIRALGDCLLLRYSDGDYIYNRNGKKIYPKKIKEAFIDAFKNYVLLLPPQDNIDMEVTIDKEGNIITPLHNKDEKPKILYKNIAIYHAGKYCGLIDYYSQKIILDAEKNEILNIEFLPHQEQFIVDRIHSEFLHSKYDIHYTVRKERRKDIYDKNMTLIKTITDTPNRNPY